MPTENMTITISKKANESMQVLIPRKWLVKWAEKLGIVEVDQIVVEFDDEKAIAKPLVK